MSFFAQILGLSNQASQRTEFVITREKTVITKVENLWLIAPRSQKTL